MASLFRQKQDAALAAGMPLSDLETLVAVLLEAAGETGMNSALKDLLSEKVQAGTPWSTLEGVTELLANSIQAVGGSTPYAAGNVTGATTLDVANGKFQVATVTGNLTLNPPANGVEGSRLELWLTPSGANRNLSLHASILIPSDSAVSFPKTLTNGDLYIVTLRHNGTAWMLVTLVGGY